MAPSAEAVTLDFFNTLVYHREGRGRGRVLMEYLKLQGLEPAPWEHQVLYDVFAPHEHAYSPQAPPHERQAYYAELTARVFERLRIPASSDDATEHAEAVWRILGSACFEIFPDALEALGALRAGGVPVAVVSNWQSGLRHFCVELGIADFCDHVLSSADLGMAKPDEHIFLEACARLGVPPQRTLHVGDTYVDDYVGGGAAGLQVALLDRAGDTDQKAVRAIRSLTELSGLVTGRDEMGSPRAT